MTRAHRFAFAGFSFLGFTVLASLFASSAAAQPLITTIAGTDFVFRGDGLPALQAPVGAIAGVAVDRAGNLYFVDVDNNMVMQVTPDGKLHVIAGNGIAGFSGDGGPATSAALDSSGGVAIDPAGNVYLADTFNSRVRRITPDGIITTVAGSHTCVDSSAIAACQGGDGGPAVNALLNQPFSVRLDSSGNLYIVDIGANRVRKVTPDGIITTFAGNGDDTGSGDGGQASRASLISPLDAVFDSTGGLYILQLGKLSRVGPDGIIRGLQLPEGLSGIAIDAADNIYLADWVDEVVVKLNATDATVVAGSGTPGFSGDGGPAAKAQITLGLFALAGMAIDSSGNLFIADIDNFRIRKVAPDGTIQTVAGNGLFGYAGDGGPAIQAAFNTPWGIVSDAAGNLYVPDGLGNRVRKIAPDRTVSTIAGSGSPGYSGDGGPALQASMYGPLALAVDPAGSVYIIDALSRIRKVTPDGIITTIAGSGGALAGKPGDQFTGSSGPALLADLGPPLFEMGLAVDAGGAVYISETANRRVRKITPDGTISTVVGSNALLQPQGLAVDAAGNLYIADVGHGIVKLTPSGSLSLVAPLPDAIAVAVGPAGSLYIAGSQQVFQLSAGGALTLVAGTGAEGYTGDGGLATRATLHFPTLATTQSQFAGIALDGQGNLYIGDAGNRRVRMVLAAPPSVSTDIPALAFTGTSTGAAALSQQFTVSGSIPLVGLALTATTADGGDWLSISATTGLTPLLVDVTADPAKLAPGIYQGTITIAAPNAVPSQLQVNVTFTVGAALPARLTTDQDHLSFAFPVGSFTRNQAVAIFNSGGGSLAFTAAVTLTNGQQRNWLTLSPSSGTVTPATPLSLGVTAIADGLPAGTYSGRVVITSAASPTPVTIPVTMTVSVKPLSILLSQSGLSFTAVADGGVAPPQSFGVLSAGTGTSPYAVEASTLSGGNWLSLSPSSGTLTATGGAAPVVTLSVNQQGLAPGRYYGLVKTRAQNAANTPQVLTVFLDVQAKDADLAAVLRPNELVFTAPAGESSPGAQEVLIYNLTGTPKSFLSVPSASGGDPLFFHVLPSDGVVQPDTPARILVQPDLGVIGKSNSLSAGTHRGTLTLQFSDGRVRNLGITFVVTAGANSAKNSTPKADAVCAPTALLPAISTLGSGFTVPAGWPLAMQVDVRDNCGTALDVGSVTAEFSNGDPPLSLRPLANGRWDATWQTRSGQSSGVTITVKARGQGGISGVKQVAGGLGASQLPPVVAPDGIVNTVAPGSTITISGDQLADGESSYSTVPVGTQLAGATVLIADQAVPLLTASGQQLKAIVPYGIEVNTTHQILIQRGLTYGRPVEVNVAAAQPQISQVSQAGSVITIFCTGLGEVTPPVPAGSAGPPLPGGAATVTPVTVTIGGANAPIQFAGLAPGMVGVYQVLATAPAGVATGSVPVVVTVQSTPPQSSDPVMTVIQ